MTGRNLTTTKKAALTLIHATLDGFAEPMRIGKACRIEQMGGILRPNEGWMTTNQLLDNARLNHQRMLPHAARVRTTAAALYPIIDPVIFGIRISYPLATRMLAVLGPLIAKKEEKERLLENCAEMFAPGMDTIGEATGLWQRVSKHPVILALALQKLKNVKVFASQAELREAMQEAEASIRSMVSAANNWMKLLIDFDRIVFEHDREGWRLAYKYVGSDVVTAMQDWEEAGDGEDFPPAPRWAEQEKLRIAKLAAEQINHRADRLVGN